LDYTLDLSAIIADYGTDTIEYVQVCIKPSGTGEAQLTNITVNGSAITLYIGNGIAGRSYVLQYNVLMVSGRQFQVFVGILFNAENAVWPPIYPPSLGYGNCIVYGQLENGMTIGGEFITIGNETLSA
jgi:hypothetical protein